VFSHFPSIHCANPACNKRKEHRGCFRQPDCSRDISLVLLELVARYSSRCHNSLRIAPQRRGGPFPRLSIRAGARKDRDAIFARSLHLRLLPIRNPNPPELCPFVRDSTRQSDAAAEPRTRIAITSRLPRVIYREAIVCAGNSEHLIFSYNSTAMFCNNTRTRTHTRAHTET